MPPQPFTRVTGVAVPMLEDDLNTPTQTAREYFDDIKAPKKAFEVIPGASHNTIIFHNELLALLKKDVLPAIAAG